VEAVLARVPHDRAVRIADVGTGSGAIAVALASALPHAHIDALDISEAALAIAIENAQANGVSGRVHFQRSDLMEAAQDRRFDAIVSNPPYVATTDTLEPQVQDWEPHAALFAGADGLEIYRRLLPQAQRLLREGGLLALEFGAGQQDPLRRLFCETASGGAAFVGLAFLPDLQGIARVALAAKHGN
jgi:release factor glutamine methyltransferase